MVIINLTPRRVKAIIRGGKKINTSFDMPIAATCVLGMLASHPGWIGSPPNYLNRSPWTRPAHHQSPLLTLVPLTNLLSIITSSNSDIYIYTYSTKRSIQSKALSGWSHRHSNPTNAKTRLNLPYSQSSFYFNAPPSFDRRHWR